MHGAGNIQPVFTVRLNEVGQVPDMSQGLQDSTLVLQLIGANIENIKFRIFFSQISQTSTRTGDK